MILNDKAHWVFEQDTVPDFAPDSEGNLIVVVDITAMPNVREGWDFNAVTGAFTEPEPPKPEPIQVIMVEPTNLQLSRQLFDLQADLVVMCDALGCCAEDWYERYMAGVVTKDTLRKLVVAGKLDEGDLSARVGYFIEEDKDYDRNAN